VFVIPVFKKILIVCVGNVCRSPIAEYLFSHHLAPTGSRIASAGIGALVGKPMDATALQLLAGCGVDGSSHRARQLSSLMLRDADLVLAVQRKHAESIRRAVPESSGKVMLLDRWCGAGDIPDPYQRDRETFESVFGMIERSVLAWMTYLQPI
jgi:protein-tyrosine phosphatase